MEKTQCEQNLVSLVNSKKYPLKGIFYFVRVRLMIASPDQGSPAIIFSEKRS